MSGHSEVDIITKNCLQLTTSEKGGVLRVMETQFEFDFEVTPFTDPDFELRDRLEEEFDLNFSVLANVPVATMVVSAIDALSAASEAVAILNQNGITVVRALEDLVSLREISDRIGVSRQAVSNWARGTRQGDLFPVPFVLGETRLWYWPEVVEFCSSRGIKMIEPPFLTLPTRLELRQVNGMIANSYGLITSGFRVMRTKLRSSIAHQAGHTSSQQILSLSAFDFALAS